MHKSDVLYTRINARYRNFTSVLQNGYNYFKHHLRSNKHNCLLHIQDKYFNITIV